MAVRVDEGHEVAMVGEEIRLSDTQLEVEDIEELPLYPTNIPLAKDTSAECPVYVLERRVVQVLRGNRVSNRREKGR